MEVSDDPNSSFQGQRNVSIVLADWKSTRNIDAQPKGACILGQAISSELSKSVPGTEYRYKGQGYHIATGERDGGGDLQDQSVSSTQDNLTISHSQTFCVILTSCLLGSKSGTLDF